MALTPEKPPSPWRGPLHLLFLFLLAAGLVVGVLGLLESDRDGLLNSAYLETVEKSIRAGFGLPPQRGPWFLVWGTAAAGFALLFEVLVFLPVTARRRRLLGLPVVVRYLLMFVLLLLGMAGVVAGAVFALVRLGDFHPTTLPVALSRPFVAWRADDGTNP
jgi:hypothetical protein